MSSSFYDLAIMSTARREDFSFGGRDNVFTISHDHDDDTDKEITTVSFLEGDDNNTVSFVIDTDYTGMTMRVTTGWGQNIKSLEISVDKMEMLLLFSAVKGVIEVREQERKDGAKH